MSYVNSHVPILLTVLSGNIVKASLKFTERHNISRLVHL